MLWRDGAVAEARADIVVHLAALAFVGHGKVEDFYSVNLMGTPCSPPWTKPGIVPNASCWQVPAIYGNRLQRYPGRRYDA